MKKFELGKKRAFFVDITDELKNQQVLSAQEVALFTKLDLVYRTLVAILFNYAPTSGHPGGSISCGRMVEHLLYKEMAYELK